MSNQNITSNFYTAIKQAVLYEQDELVKSLIEKEAETGRSLADIHAERFAAMSAVLDMKKEDGKFENPFQSKNSASLETALQLMGFKLRYNVRSSQPEVCAFGDWMQFHDRFQDSVRVKLADLFTYETANGPKPLHYGSESWRMYLNAILHDSECDPFLDWLGELPEWDGTGRVDSYLTDLFTVEPTPITLWVSQFLLLGPIQRAYEPGAKLDQMPILAGKQDIGKSTLLACLFPDHHRAAWFSDGLDLASDSKTRAESLIGRVLIEASEMAGSTRADLESLKSFITRTDDGTVRLAYRRNPETMPRRSVIVGTADRTSFLPNDPSGLRRFVPVDLPTSTGPVEPYMRDNRTQLWAEALDRYRKGARAGLPRALKLEAAAAAEAHRNADALIEDRVDAITASTEDGCRLVELAVSVGLATDTEAAVKLNMRDQRRLGAALKNGGWEDYKTRQGKRWRRVHRT